MSDVKYTEVNGGRVVRLNAWPKPILDADGNPKDRPAVKAVKGKGKVKAEAESTEVQEPGPDAT